jgi:signal transduction histidine kinase
MSRGDCNAVLARVTATLAPVIDDAEGLLVVGPLPSIEVDAVLLAQVFQNLVSNAVKFRHPDATPVVHIRAEASESGWQFRVTDNGIGIDPRHRERVFGMFKRLNPRAGYPGTGVGLAVCKKIVELHGGRIWIESAPEGGTSFCFFLPAEQGRS